MPVAPACSRFALLALLTVALPAMARAESPATQRSVRNLEMALGNIKLVEAYRKGPIDEKKMQDARNLLRDLDYGLGRAERELNSIAPADRDLPSVQALTRRAEELKAFQVELKQAIEGAAAAAGALDGRYREFREETKRFAPPVSLYRDAHKSPDAYARVSAKGLAASMKELGELDALCKAKYADLPHNERLSFQLAIDPATWCGIADRRKELGERSAKRLVEAEVAKWVAAIEKDRALLEPTGGLIDLRGLTSLVASEREAARAELAQFCKAILDAVQLPMAADLLAPLDPKLAALYAEIDRLAPTYTFPSGLSHDAGIEGAAKKRLAGFTPGAQVLKTGMLRPDWSISKNGLGIPTDRFRSGAILFRAPGSKWCRSGEFTYLEPYAGGGKYQHSDRFTFTVTRFLKCP
ncbi:MAG: hypothetical protein EXR72_24495 [Myxococcales bacterium]|nr:hypothetical protein [Myxococcales bacterium]